MSQKARFGSLHGVVCAISMLALSGCGDPAGPKDGTVMFQPDAASCFGSSLVSLSIDGTTVATATLSAGNSSEAFQVPPGSHTVGAESITTGTKWAAANVFISPGEEYTHALACSLDAPLAPHETVLNNHLTLPVSLSVTDWVSGTIAAGGATPTIGVIQYAGTRLLTWRPVPLTFSDGSVVPDDGPIVTVTLTPRGNYDITATQGTAEYFSFSLTNRTGVPIDIGLHSRCLATVGSSVSTYRFPYYRLRANSEVRYYKGGSDCSGSFVSFDASVLAARGEKSGFIALTATVSP